MRSKDTKIVYHRLAELLKKNFFLRFLLCPLKTFLADFFVGKHFQNVPFENILFFAQFRRFPYFAASNSVAKVKFRRCPLFSSYPSLTLPPPSPLLPSSPPWRHLPCPTWGSPLFFENPATVIFQSVLTLLTQKNFWQVKWQNSLMPNISFCHSLNSMVPWCHPLLPRFPTSLVVCCSPLLLPCFFSLAVCWFLHSLLETFIAFSIPCWSLSSPLCFFAATIYYFLNSATETFVAFLILNWCVLLLLFFRMEIKY